MQEASFPPMTMVVYSGPDTMKELQRIMSDLIDQVRGIARCEGLSNLNVRRLVSELV